MTVGAVSQQDIQIVNADLPTAPAVPPIKNLAPKVWREYMTPRQAGKHSEHMTISEQWQRSRPQFGRYAC